MNAPQQPAMNRQFSVIWTNNATYTRPMSRHGVTLRGVGIGGMEGLTYNALHLDQVQIVFRPNTSITAPEYVAPDSENYTWRVETSQLFVRTRPGKQHVLISTGSNDRTTPVGTVTSQSEGRHSVVYSAALSLAPNVDGNEDYWVRTYRPVRDLPIAEHGCGESELDIELFFPLMLDDERALPFTAVPDYRILKVLCEFSVRV